MLPAIKYLRTNYSHMLAWLVFVNIESDLYLCSPLHYQKSTIWFKFLDENTACSREKVTTVDNYACAPG